MYVMLFENDYDRLPTIDEESQSKIRIAECKDSSAIQVLDMECADERATSGQSNMTKSYFYVLLIFMIYSIAQCITIPAVPNLVLDITHGNSSLSSIYMGISSFLRYLLQFLSSPILGTLADLYGRKRLMILSLVVCFIELFLLGLYPTVFMLFVSRIMSGIGDATTVLTYIIVTDVCKHRSDNITQKFGLIGAMFGLSLIIGPVLGGLISLYSNRLCIMLAALISLVNVVLCNRYLEETSLQSETIQNEASTTTNPSSHNHSHVDVSSLYHLFQQQVAASLDNISKHLSNKALRQLTIPYVLSNFAFGYLFIWYIYMDYRFHSSSFEIGLYLAFNGVLSVIVLGVLINYLIPALMSEKDASFYGLMLHALSTVLLGCSYNISMLYVITLVFAIQTVHVAALKATIIEESLHDKRSEKLQGNLQVSESGHALAHRIVKIDRQTVLLTLPD